LVLDALDRGNLALAAVQMKQAWDFRTAALGVAGGFVGIGYAIAAIPSTLALQRVGARRWMSLLMLVWAFAPPAPRWYRIAATGIARILLASPKRASLRTHPYLTYWLPSEYRGRVLASVLMFTAGIGVISGPMGSGLLSLDGFLGLAGWKWLFIVEGLPTIVLACIVFRFLPDRPAEARWLTSPQRDWLTERLAAQPRLLLLSRAIRSGGVRSQRMGGVVGSHLSGYAHERHRSS